MLRAAARSAMYSVATTNTTTSATNTQRAFPMPEANTEMPVDCWPVIVTSNDPRAPMTKVAIGRNGNRKKTSANADGSLPEMAMAISAMTPMTMNTTAYTMTDSAMVRTKPRVRCIQRQAAMNTLLESGANWANA